MLFSTYWRRAPLDQGLYKFISDIVENIKRRLRKGFIDDKSLQKLLPMVQKTSKMLS